MSFPAEFLAAAPDDWKRTAYRVGIPAITIAGLFVAEPQIAEFGGGLPLADPARQFHVQPADAAAFELAVNDYLVIDGTEYRVTDLGPVDDAGFVAATLRTYG